MPAETSERPGPHQRKPMRLPSFDYASEGSYFVTLVTKNREQLFGEIINDEMALSEFGKIVTEEWERSASIREEIELGVYVIMPNHFHGIVYIFKNLKQPTINHSSDPPEIDHHVVGAYGHTPLQKPKLFRSPSHSLGAMVRGFKSAVATRINTLRGTLGVPLWQRNFDDRVVRNEHEYAIIERYIQENPIKWAVDKENRDFVM